MIFDPIPAVRWCRSIANDGVNSALMSDTKKVREYVEYHYGPLPDDAIQIPDGCKIEAGVIADALSALLARGLPPERISFVCTKLLTDCSSNDVLLVRFRDVVCELSNVPPSAHATTICASYQATDTRAAMGFCFTSVCQMLDAACK